MVGKERDDSDVKTQISGVKKPRFLFSFVSF